MGRNKKVFPIFFDIIFSADRKFLLDRVPNQLKGIHCPKLNIHTTMNTIQKHLTVALALVGGLWFSNPAQAQRNNRNGNGHDNRRVVVREPARRPAVVNSPVVVNRPAVVRQPVRYAALPAYRSRVTVLPTRTRIVPLGGISYRYHNGLYYRPIGTSFELVSAPVGFRLNVLPPGYRRILVGPNPYYYYYGAFYQPLPNNDGYQVIAPPVGAIVYELPNGYDRVVIEGITYYVNDGVYYRADVDEQGNVIYEVVGKR